MSVNRMTPLARTLRRNATDVEAKLWQHLKGRQLEGAKFRRQLPIARFVADFACEEVRLVVELDGGQHAERAEHDRNRSEILEAHGYTVLRFWNSDVTENLDGVLEEIRRAILIARSA